MAVKKNNNKPKVPEKGTEQSLEKEFATLLAMLKPQLSDKKFQHRIKKAIKILTHGLDKKKRTKVKPAKPSPPAAKKKAKIVVKKATKK